MLPPKPWKNGAQPAGDVSMLVNRPNKCDGFLRALAALVTFLLLAACQTDNDLVTGSLSGNAPRSIAFESIDGPPQPIFQRLVKQLSAEAENRQLPVVSRSNAAAWRVRLYLAAHVQKRWATISWVGDIFDSRHDRAFRVSGEEPVGLARKDVWSLADDAVLARIAAKSLDAIVARMTIPDLPNDSAPGSPPGDGSPVASAEGPNTLAFADPGHWVAETHE
jgi:hypothetical protein